MYDEDAQGRPVYNWSYVDQIYDGLLDNHIRPFVELSFMPKKLSSSDHVHAFWYRPLPNPPKDDGKWAALVEAFARHLIERYGIDEVSQWYFEVWNEPNIDFWTGTPAQSVRKVYQEVQSSPLPNVPIIWSEYNASYFNEVAVTDSPFMGPWLANNIRMCDGLQTIMAYWDFSDVFEEQGVVKTPFYGGFGLIAAGGIPKAPYGAFLLLAKLGVERLPSTSENALITRASGGELEIALWNYAEPEQAGSPRTFTIDLGTPHAVNIYRIDENHGSSLNAWRAMGSPAYPTRIQIEKLREAALIPQPEQRQAEPRIDVTVPPHGLVLLEVRR